MNELKHYAFPIPPYYTSPVATVGGRGLSRRAVQYTRPISEVDTGDRVAIEHAVTLHTKQLDQLSEAAANLRNKIKEWDDIDDDNGEVSNDEVGTAGDYLAGAALRVVELLKELGH